jgi:hypothetical protein
VLIIKLFQSNLQLAGAEMKVVCFSPLKYGASVYNLSAFALIYFFYFAWYHQVSSSKLTFSDPTEECCYISA